MNIIFFSALDESNLSITDQIRVENVASSFSVCRLLKKMSDMFRISIEGGEPITKKGKLEPISINVLQRAGNKKVRPGSN